MLNLLIIVSWLLVINMNILFIGDIVGRSAREAVVKVLPHLKEKFKIDLVIANGENLANGSGITKKTVEEIKSAGLNLLTSGNHIWKKKDAFDIANEKDTFVLRPANYPQGVPGKGWKIIQVGSSSVMIINLIGRVFMKEQFDCPFRKLDDIIKETQMLYPDIIIVDFHAEATSEKRAFGFYADGKVSAVLGTHTHIQTSDNQILPKGTAYITDVGMAGAQESVLGVKVDESIKNFLYQMGQKLEVEKEKSPIEINAVVLKFEGKKIIEIERIMEIVDI